MSRVLATSPNPSIILVTHRSKKPSKMRHKTPTARANELTINNLHDTEIKHTPLPRCVTNRPITLESPTMSRVVTNRDLMRRRPSLPGLQYSDVHSRNPLLGGRPRSHRSPQPPGQTQRLDSHHGNRSPG